LGKCWGIRGCKATCKFTPGSAVHPKCSGMCDSGQS
jgi:hypothetical protein